MHHDALHWMEHQTFLKQKIAKQATILLPLEDVAVLPSEMRRNVSHSTKDHIHGSLQQLEKKIKEKSPK